MAIPQEGDFSHEWGDFEYVKTRVHELVLNPGGWGEDLSGHESLQRQEDGSLLITTGGDFNYEVHVIGGELVVYRYQVSMKEKE